MTMKHIFMTMKYIHMYMHDNEIYTWKYVHACMYVHDILSKAGNKVRRIYMYVYIYTEHQICECMYLYVTEQ